MGKQYDQIEARDIAFIEAQKIFFVATAGCEGRINLSPKGMDSLRVMDPCRIIWLNVTGSGNETAVHVEENGRMTLMFCAFDGAPLILKVYGKAKAVHKGDAAWETLSSLLPNIPGARQIFDLAIDTVIGSCGMAVPYFDYKGERDDLRDWAKSEGEEGIRAYWEKKNQISLDGKETGILEKSRKDDD